MNLLSIEQLSKSYTDKVILQNINFGINQGDKIGVIGINGTGKSTLLKMIMGIEEPDEGNVIRGKHLRMAYLPQTPIFDQRLSILENVIKDQKAEEEYHNLEGKACSMLKRFGITAWDEKAEYLSGGQKKRAALVRTLLTPADLLVLDEPTNHLDSEMAEWLQDYLKKSSGAFIMITHDRYFLDEAANRIVEIDKGKLYVYAANYSGFVERKAEREEIALATERKNKSLYRMELEWMMRGARARSTKQKAHISRFEELRDREKIEQDGRVELSSFSSRLGKKTIEMIGLEKSFSGKKLIHDFTYLLLPRDRIGIVGANGCGKSTLLKLMTGILKPDEGVVEIGQTVKIGYFSQENEYMNESIQVIDYIRGIAEYVQTGDGAMSASQMLEKFLFSGSMQYAPIAKLSGGEKRRLYLLGILMEAPNILILDEPTNDLDITTLNILEDYLNNFEGIVVAVSHDRYFLDKVVSRIFAFEENGKIVQYEGNYSDYRRAKDSPTEQEHMVESEKKEKSGNNWRVREEKPRFTYQEKKDYEVIDAEIEELENRIAQLEREIEESAFDYIELEKLIHEKEQLEKKLEEKTERWIYLNDIAEKILEAARKGL